MAPKFHLHFKCARNVAQIIMGRIKVIAYAYSVTDARELSDPALDLRSFKSTFIKLTNISHR